MAGAGLCGGRQICYAHLAVFVLGFLEFSLGSPLNAEVYDWGNLPGLIARRNDANPPPKGGGGGTVLKLAEDPVCAADISRLCGKHNARNNFAVIKCLQNEVTKDEDISDKCDRLVWSYKLNLTMDFRFDMVAGEIHVCGTTLDQIPECRDLPSGVGQVIPCLIENIDNVTNTKCNAFLKRMETIVFSDYRLIYKFTEKCKDDIERHSCGRLPPVGDAENQAPHNQGQTLTCLAQHVDSLNQQCKHELLRVAELQADDYRKDRPLYYACREDRENFCHKVKAGAGRIYKCLYRHKFDPHMSENCMKMLTLRQQLQQENYKVNLKLAKACQNDIVKNKCLNDIEEVANFRNARLSAVLLCLQGAMKDGIEVNNECIVELKEIRRSLMEDYQINPVLVRDCSKEIQEHCGSGLHRDKKTIHCLMDLARTKKEENPSISDKCVRALVDVLEQVDVGDNYEVDPVIEEDCGPVIRALCKDEQAGEGRWMNCLMESLSKPSMTETCKARLLEIYYFITRDFRLDSRLYKFCRQDARTLCSAPKTWHFSYAAEQFRPAMQQLVFACLYRHLIPIPSRQDSKWVSWQCGTEVQRVMRERAISVDLDPMIESHCLTDLGHHCSEKTEKAEMMECLEYHFDSLNDGCKKVISEYIEAADVAPELNDIFLLSCAPFWDEYCAQAIQNGWQKKKEDMKANKWDDNDDEYDDEDDDEDDAKNDEIGENLMACLIRYKYHPSMDTKCRVGIEHHQLATAKDFHLSVQFSQACKHDIYDHCLAAKTNPKKSYVVQCLSEIVRNDTIHEIKPRISKGCRKQLKFELLQRSSNIKLDPDLDEACKSDVETKCPNVSPGQGDVIACLRKHQEMLSNKCRRMIFKRELEEAQDPVTDYYLMSKCKYTIKRYCVEELTSPDSIFECLQRNKEEEKFDKACQKAIIIREELKAKDIRLSPFLMKKCSDDARKFCASELADRSSDKEDEGRVLLCLRKQFVLKQLSEICEEHVREVVVESAKYYTQDLQLVKACSEEIYSYCVDDLSNAVDCLKNLVEKNRLDKESSACYVEVVRVIEESQVDIHADSRLYRACAVDVKQHCGDIPRGAGKQMSCLIKIFNDKKIPLDNSCDRTLLLRMTLWNAVSRERVPVADFQELTNSIEASSPSRIYFIGVVLGVIGVVFFVGLFCGRITSVRCYIKNERDLELPSKVMT